MNNLTLLSNQYKIFGWFIFIPALILGIFSLTDILQFQEISLPVFYNSGMFFLKQETGLFSTTYVSALPNVAGLLIIIGGVFVGFSEEKIEDEYISSLRLQAVFWSLKVTYIIVFFLILTVFGTLFFTLMIVLMFLPLVLYIFRFNYLLLKK